MADFLLIHGACLGGWTWTDVVDGLRTAGHRAVAPDLPCDDLDAGLSEYADVAAAALGDTTGDVVVVGHSLGALVAPLVATRVRTRRLVMLAGIVGAPGRSLADLSVEDADRDLPLGDDEIDLDGAGRFRFSASGARRTLFHDCDPGGTDAWIDRLRFQRSMWTEVADFDWPDAEIVSVTCTDDRLVNPAWSDRVARERLGVQPVHLAGGHLPSIARPAELCAVLTTGL